MHEKPYASTEHRIAVFWLDECLCMPLLDLLCRRGILPVYSSDTSDQTECESDIQEPTMNLYPKHSLFCREGYVIRLAASSRRLLSWSRACAEKDWPRVHIYQCIAIVCEPSGLCNSASVILDVVCSNNVQTSQ